MCAEWATPLATRWDGQGYRRSSRSSASSSSEGVSWKKPDDRRRERLNSELLTAVCHSDVYRLNRLLQDSGSRPSLNAFCSVSKASPLHIAALRGDVEILEVLLSAGANTDCRDHSGRLPLHLAAWEGNIQVIQALLKANHAVINLPVAPVVNHWKPGEGCGWEHDHREVSSLMSLVKTEEGSTALHIASMHCQLGVVDYLLKNGANVQVTDRKGRTALDVAGLESTGSQAKQEYQPQFSCPGPDSFPTTYSNVMGNSFVIPQAFFKPASSGPSIPPSPEPMHEKPSFLSVPPSVEPIGLEAVGLNINKALHHIVNTLMNSGARLAEEEIDGELQSPSSSALHSAILSDDVAVMELLIESGANLCSFDKDGDTPLHLSVRRRKFEPLKTIIRWLKPEKIDMKNKEGLSALHLAVSIEWPEGVGYLLESRASIKIKTDGDGTTVYHMAAKLGNPKLMEELLMVEGSSEVVDEKDSNGFTPLIWAIQRPSAIVVEQLVKTAKANVTVHLKDGTNIVHLAVDNSDASVLKYLTRLPACKKLLNEISPPESNGMAPLHVAADQGNVQFCQLLLTAGADPNLHTTDEPKGKATALHLAAKKGFRRTVDEILRHDNCCLNAEDNNGWKPLHMACLYGHGKTAVALIQHGADLSDEINFHGTKKTALDLMVVNVPRTCELLETLLDSYIEIPSRKNYRDMKFLYNPSCAILLKFEVLLSSNDPCGRQLTFLNSIVNTNDSKVKEILLHPLIEIFLHIKWDKLWKFFAILLFLYFLHTAALTAFCTVLFIEHYNAYIGKSILQFTFLATLVPIVLAEAMQVLRLERRYWNDHESWVKWMMILTSGIVGYGSVFDNDTEWIRHFSSFAILSSWIELLFLFSRFRYWGLDVLMFEKVIENVLTVLSKFVFLFLGFMFALMVHFEGAAPFNNFWDSFCQSVIMVVELNYGGVFPEGSTTINAVIGRLMYVAYMIFVALAMTNLTVGLAVSDIAALEKQGRVESLVKRTSFLSFLETLVYDERLASCFPPQTGKRAHSFRSVDAECTVFPNKPGGVLPLSLKSALLLKVQEPEKTESLSTEHFDEMINEMNKKVEKMSEEIAALQKNEKINAAQMGGR